MFFLLERKPVAMDHTESCLLGSFLTSLPSMHNEAALKAKFGQLFILESDPDNFRFQLNLSSPWEWLCNIQQDSDSVVPNLGTRNRTNRSLYIICASTEIKSQGTVYCFKQK
jgi:hypothetical protein